MALEGKVVMVTGAARGIGRYIARTFAEAGAKLAVADILPLDDTAAELRAMDIEVLPVDLDIRDEKNVQKAMELVNAHFGQIDVLVNNAAIATHAEWEEHWPLIRDMEKGFWDRIMDTNVGGTFLCTKHVLPYMEKQGGGHIINLSGGGRLQPFGACVYVASKDAVRTFTRFVAEEEREHGICIVTCGPSGAIATEDAPEEVKQRMPGPESVGNRFVLAAQVGMEMSGKALRAREDGQLEAAS